MNLKLIAAAAAILAGAATAQAASAGVVLSDNFNADALALNWTGDSVFTSNAVADAGGAIASTDLIGSGYFDFFPGNGNYVDLDGSTGYGNLPVAGQLESNSAVGAGKYTLTFDLGGNARGAADQTTVISLGGFTDSITLASGAPLATHSVTFNTAGGNLFFTESGPSDQQGNILDNVTLSTAVTGTGDLGADADRLRRHGQPRCATAAASWPPRPPDRILGFKTSAPLAQSRRRFCLRGIPELADGLAGPAAAQRFNQRDGGGHALALQGQQRFTSIERRGLGHHHAGVGHRAGAVLVQRNLLGQVGGLGGLGPQRLLILQHMVGGQIVLDLLEGGQRGLTIERHGLVIGGPRATVLRAGGEAVRTRSPTRW